LRDTCKDETIRRLGFDEPLHFQLFFGCKLLMACFYEIWDLAPGDQRQVPSLLLIGYLAQIDYGYSTFGLADLKKFDEIIATHYRMDKLESWKWILCSNRHGQDSGH
jgi:hypothetical protein